MTGTHPPRERDLERDRESEVDAKLSSPPPTLDVNATSPSNATAAAPLPSASHMAYTPAAPGETSKFSARPASSKMDLAFSNGFASATSSLASSFEGLSLSSSFTPFSLGSGSSSGFAPSLGTSSNTSSLSFSTQSFSGLPSPFGDPTSSSRSSSSSLTTIWSNSDFSSQSLPSMMSNGVASHRHGGAGTTRKKRRSRMAQGSGADAASPLPLGGAGSAAPSASPLVSVSSRGAHSYAHHHPLDKPTTTRIPSDSSDGLPRKVRATAAKNTRDSRGAPAHKARRRSAGPTALHARNGKSNHSRPSGHNIEQNHHSSVGRINMAQSSSQSYLRAPESGETDEVTNAGEPRLSQTPPSLPATSSIPSGESTSSTSFRPGALSALPPYLPGTSSRSNSASSLLLPSSGLTSSQFSTFSSHQTSFSSHPHGTLAQSHADADSSHRVGAARPASASFLNHSTSSESPLTSFHPSSSHNDFSFLAGGGTSGASGGGSTGLFGAGGGRSSLGHDASGADMSHLHHVHSRRSDMEHYLDDSRQEFMGSQTSSIPSASSLFSSRASDEASLQFINEWQHSSTSSAARGGDNLSQLFPDDGVGVGSGLDQGHGNSALGSLGSGTGIGSKRFFRSDSFGGVSDSELAAAAAGADGSDSYRREPTLDLGGSSNKLRARHAPPPPASSFAGGRRAPLDLPEGFFSSGTSNGFSDENHGGDIPECVDLSPSPHPHYHFSQSLRHDSSANAFGNLPHSHSLHSSTSMGSHLDPTSGGGGLLSSLQSSGGSLPVGEFLSSTGGSGLLHDEPSAFGASSFDFGRSHRSGSGLSLNPPLNSATQRITQIGLGGTHASGGGASNGGSLSAPTSLSPSDNMGVGVGGSHSFPLVPEQPRRAYVACPQCGTNLGYNPEQSMLVKCPSCQGVLNTQDGEPFDGETEVWVIQTAVVSGTPNRCRICNLQKSRKAFSKAQLKKGKSYRICKECYQSRSEIFDACEQHIANKEYEILVKDMILGDFLERDDWEALEFVYSRLCSLSIPWMSHREQWRRPPAEFFELLREHTDGFKHILAKLHASQVNQDFLGGVCALMSLYVVSFCSPDDTSSSSRGHQKSTSSSASSQPISSAADANAPHPSPTTAANAASSDANAESHVPETSAAAASSSPAPEPRRTSSSSAPGSATKGGGGGGGGGRKSSSKGGGGHLCKDKQRCANGNGGGDQKSSSSAVGDEPPELIPGQNSAHLREILTDDQLVRSLTELLESALAKRENGVVTHLLALVERYVEFGCRNMFPLLGAPSSSESSAEYRGSSRSSSRSGGSGSGHPSDSSPAMDSGEMHHDESEAGRYLLEAVGKALVSDRLDESEYALPQESALNIFLALWRKYGCEQAADLLTSSRALRYVIEFYTSFPYANYRPSLLKLKALVLIREVSLFIDVQSVPLDIGFKTKEELELFGQFMHRLFLVARPQKDNDEPPRLREKPEKRFHWKLAHLIVASKPEKTSPQQKAVATAKLDRMLRLFRQYHRLTGVLNKSCSAPRCVHQDDGGLSGRVFQFCEKCGVDRYCSTDCRKSHWNNGHKETCKLFTSFLPGAQSD